MTNEGHDMQAVDSSLATAAAAAHRIYRRMAEHEERITSLQQLVIKLQLQIDSPAAESLDAVTNLARIKGMHWLNIFHLNWSESIDESLAKINREYRDFTAQREHESDPHGSSNG